jgi:phage major head subunit gpT-like protein
MLINQASLDGVFTSLNAIFNAAFTGVEPTHEQIAMVVPSNTRTNDYKFMMQFPMLQEWIGDRTLKSLASEHFTISNKDYEASIEVDRNDIEDDQIGIYNPIVAELGRAAAQHPSKLLATLMATGFSTTCYDGQYFFDTDHSVGGANVSNYGGGAGTAWYLLDATRAIRPFIFQRRTMPQLTRQDRPDDENYFMRKKFRYGVDYRGAVGYGLWQLAYASKDTLNESNLQTAITAMKDFKNDEGVKLGITPSLLIVPNSLEFTARGILERDLLGVTGEGTKSNIMKGMLQLMVNHWL